MANRDVFDVTFEALQRSLHASSGRNFVAMNSLEAVLDDIILAEVQNKTDKHREELQALRNMVFARYVNEGKARVNAVSQVEGGKRLYLATCREYEHVVQRRLATQKASAEKRMKDLVFEVVGEYGKSNIRICRRQEYLRKTGRTKVLSATWAQNWQKFAVRLKFDICQGMLHDRPPEPQAFVTCQNIMQCHHLALESDAEEMEAVVRKVSKKMGLIADQRMIVQSIVRVAKNSKDRALLPSSFRVATTTKDLQEILQLLKAWSRRSAPPPVPAAAAQSGSAGVARNISSRGRSAGGGTRSRPLPQSAAAPSVPYLKELVSTDCVDWLHPASYHPTLWDDAYGTQYFAAPGSIGTAGVADQDPFTSFVRKYHAQHTGSLWNTRAYFCLEERSLAARSDRDTEARAVSPDSALLAVLSGVADGNKEEKRVALENAITMQMLTTLQEIYVDHPYVYVTHPHESLRSENPGDSLCSLRGLLAQPLTVVGFSGKHRLGLMKGGAAASASTSKTMQIIHKYLPTVPDIMVVRAANGAVLHFAPAMLANLPETLFYSAGGLSPEQQRQASLRCPHPQLGSLSIPGSHLLSTLFCPVLTQHVDANHVLRDTAGANNGKPGMLSPLAPVPAAPVPAKVNPGPKEALAETLLKKKDPRQNYISTDGLPLSPLLMMPLATDAMVTLLQRYLVAHSLSPSIGEVLSPRGEESLPPGSSPAWPLSAVNILPDHARHRVTTTALSSASDNAGVAAAAGEDDRRKLRCTYLLLPDDKAAEIAAAAADFSNTPRRNSGGDSPKPTVVPNQCYYFIQLYPLEDETALFRQEPFSARKGAEVESELDDGGNDPLSLTFALTQSGKPGAAAGGMSGKSAFDRSIQYDAEDDLLRRTLLQEYRSALSCDVVISPPARPAAGHKDQKGQGVGQRQGDPGSTKKAAVGAGGGRGPLSSLGASLVGGLHASQVLEDDHDEGDGDGDAGTAGSDSPVGHGGGAAQASKRRWDPSVLSTVCRWRSCLCDSALVRVGKSNTFKQKQLCSYHLELKAFLDGRGGKQATSESAKYLPRRAPNFNASALAEKKRDMMTIRAASTLLQELWDGKLRATVRSFTKKVVRDMGLRVFLEGANTTFLISLPGLVAYLTGTTPEATLGRHANNPFSVRAYQERRPAVEKIANSVVPAQPTWAIWKSKPYLERTVEGQKLSLSILEAILLTEKTIRQETELLADLRAYPSAELVLIRKEVRAFKEQQEQILTKNGGEGDVGRQKDPSGDGGATLEDLASGLTSGYDDLVAILSAENKLCERKLLLLACRRQEEEERRTAYMKKLARAKMTEEANVRDPVNFRNQRF